MLLICITLSSGCLSDPMSKVGDVTVTSLIQLFQKEDQYQIDTDDLTIPDIPLQQRSDFDKRPTELSDSLPGFEISSYYYYTELYEGAENVISVHVSNTGNMPVHIYQFGFMIINDNRKIARECGVNVGPGEDRMVGLIAVEVPEDLKELKLQPQVSIMAQTVSGKWHDYREQQFEEVSIDVLKQVPIGEPVYINNPENIFREINNKIEPFDPDVRSMAASSAKKYPGQYNIYQICSLFDDTKRDIQYISDPRGKDIWSTPNETLTIGAGDCDDYAILLASLIESIGGTSRIYLTDNHAFATVYIGNNTEKMANAISKHYGPVPVYYTTDEYGSWLILDPTSSIYAGGLPGGTAPTEQRWTFLNTTTVTVVDIFP